MSDWGKGALNNNIGWGQGNFNNISWGSVYQFSYFGQTIVFPSRVFSIEFDNTFN